jgi:dolichol-phosphate mannosyltransferase
MLSYLTALPVYNEASHVAPVLAQVRQYSPRVLVVDDGSTDGTLEEVAKFADVKLIRHERNRGYGAALQSAFEFALQTCCDVLVTIDCDGQHEPALIPSLMAAMTDEVDIVSGSRYLAPHPRDSEPPEDRRRINQIITAQLNDRLGLRLTDAFCGFKAYRTSALAKLEVTETGYAMPLEMWVQAVAANLRIIEFPVPLVYLDEKRSFGGSLDDARARQAHYEQVLARQLERHASRLPRRARPLPSRH